MSRKRVAVKRKIAPDPKYKSMLVAKFVNNLMKKGKKNTAQSILYNAFDLIEERTSKDPLGVFQSALENVRPVVEVKSRRVGGSTYQVPTEVRPARRQASACDGLSAIPGQGVKRPWPPSWRENSSMPPMKEGRLSRKRKIRTGWLRPTRRLHTTAGKSDH